MDFFFSNIMQQTDVDSLKAVILYNNRDKVLFYKNLNTYCSLRVNINTGGEKLAIYIPLVPVIVDCIG